MKIKSRQQPVYVRIIRVFAHKVAIYFESRIVLFVLYVEPSAQIPVPCIERIQCVGFAAVHCRLVRTSESEKYVRRLVIRRSVRGVGLYGLVQQTQGGIETVFYERFFQRFGVVQRRKARGVEFYYVGGRNDGRFPYSAREYGQRYYYRIDNPAFHFSVQE
ncbi:MAG: hypothetical protein L6V35_03690 [Alistipes putredinis]|nr:MAG: hypothetical protein L6V35_03690 [Alistipes putredinis]